MGTSLQDLDESAVFGEVSVAESDASAVFGEASTANATELEASQVFGPDESRLPATLPNNGRRSSVSSAQSTTTVSSRVSLPVSFVMPNSIF